MTNAPTPIGVAHSNRLLTLGLYYATPQTDPVCDLKEERWLRFIERLTERAASEKLISLALSQNTGDNRAVADGQRGRCRC